MPLKVSDGMGAWIDDFKKSDAPQFKGKSAEERRDMAIAAYMSAKKGPKDEGKVDEISSNKLGDYMTKSAADAARPGQSARTQDKRIAGQSMADKKIRKKMGYSSDAKVPAGINAGMNEAVHSADKKPEKYIGSDGKMKVRMVPVDKEVVKQEDKAADRAALQKAMDIYKKRGGKVTKVAPGKAAGYHGKDDPGKDMRGMMDKGDTKDMPKKKYMGSMK